MKNLIETFIPESIRPVIALIVINLIAFGVRKAIQYYFELKLTILKRFLKKS